MKSLIIPLVMSKEEYKRFHLIMALYGTITMTVGVFIGLVGPLGYYSLMLPLAFLGGYLFGMITNKERLK